MIPGPDDGKVAVRHAALAGMQDSLALPSMHPFLMSNADVQQQTLRFLAHGGFDHSQGMPTIPEFCQQRNIELPIIVNN